MDVLSVWLQALSDKVLPFFPRLVAALVLFFASLYLARWAAHGMKRALAVRKTDYEIRLLLTRLVHWSVVGLGVALALEQMNFDLTAFLAGLGIIGFTIGFALQDVSKNFVAGILLLVQQPFDIGDAIEVEGYSGTVTRVSLRATELRTVDGLLVLIPNGDVYVSVIKNFSKTQRRRLELPIGVACDSDLDRVTRSALAALAGIPGIVQEPAPQVIFLAFGQSSIDMTIYFWVELSQTTFLDAQDRAGRAVKAAFDQAGIELPFPTHHVLTRAVN
ncbi:MAG: mechanosensitive ion channel [Thermoflexales bacterium]|nr:mechanosensitive ion channel [Thermoflexales bacterium]